MNSKPYIGNRYFSSKRKESLSIYYLAENLVNEQVIHKGDGPAVISICGLVRHYQWGSKIREGNAETESEMGWQEWTYPGLGDYQCETWAMEIDPEDYES